jgi:NADPH:quinone reductase-like Zn-dependent oxidoreductase
MVTYRAVVLEGKGGLDRLVVKDLPRVDPGPGEIRIRVRATGAGSTDITMRTSFYPYRPPFPFSPGYEVVGEVDAIGEGVEGLSMGQRVCALTVHGGQAEYLVREADHFVPVPDGLDDADVVALILNYVTAYQMIHRAGKAKKGQSALVSGANGGVGTAALEILRLLGARVIGAASRKHFELVRDLGGEPIESRARPLGEQVRMLVPDGVDVSFDAMGGAGTREHTDATKKRGIVVGYGLMAAPSLLPFLRGLVAIYVGTRLAGRRGTFYGITALYRKDRRPFKEDLPKLFELLRAGEIKPRIATRLGLLDGVKAQEMLERGGVQGKIVLMA